MKLFKIHISLFLLVAVLLCIPSFLFAKAEERVEKTFNFITDGKVYLKNISGDIAVQSWDKNEVKIMALKVAGRKRDLDRTTIDIRQTNGNIRIITKNRKSGSVDFELFVPNKAQVRMETVSGRVEAKDIGGFLDIKTISGDINVVNAYDGVKGKTISGYISLQKTKGAADLKTTSGKISINGIQGSIEAETVSGEIEIEAFSHAETIEVETISGGTKLNGELNPGGIYEVESLSGKIKMLLPPDSNFELQTETFSGEIECDFELRISGQIDPKKIRGMVGKGGASLIISSFSGDIRITKH